MNKQEFESELALMIVDNNWDLHCGVSSTTEAIFEPRVRKYWGPNYASREQMKSKGWAMVTSKREEDRLLGYGLVAYSHFYRSQEVSLKAKRKHPNFTEFMAHWLHSDPKLVNGSERRPLAALYPAPKKLKIARGRSYWGTAA